MLLFEGWYFIFVILIFVILFSVDLGELWFCDDLIVVCWLDSGVVLVGVILGGLW